MALILPSFSLKKVTKYMELYGGLLSKTLGAAWDESRI